MRIHLLVWPLVWGGLVVGLSGCARKTVSTVDIAAAEVEAKVPATGAGEPFQFPKDASGALLAKVLPPSEGPRMLADPSRVGRPFPMPPAVAAPAYKPLAPAVAAIPTLPVEKAKHEIRPRLVMDEGTFSPREELSLPQAVSFPVPDRVRLASQDVNQPVPPPILATPLPDRAPMDDLTAAASAAAAVAAPLPWRTAPAPFLRLFIHDPYENRRSVRLPMIPAEEATPISAAPRPPRP
jgi:hypothetical protein